MEIIKRIWFVFSLHSLGIGEEGICRTTAKKTRLFDLLLLFKSQSSIPRWQKLQNISEALLISSL